MIKVVIVAILVSLTLTVLILLHAGRIQDETAAETSLRQVEGLLLMTGRHLADHVRDYAVWDDAIERVVLARDADWWDGNPGQYAMIKSVLPIAISAFSSVVGLTLLFAFRARTLARRLSADEAARHELAQHYESILETAGDGIFGVDRDGRIQFVNTVRPMLLGDTPTGAVVVFRDITKRRHTEEDILYRANFDAVTGLPNRNLLLERLGQELKRARREATCVGILFIDLDDFKQVNDSLGHDAGDLLLRQVAERLQDSVRDTDTVARFAGDELVVVAAHIPDWALLQTVAEKLLQVLREPFAIGDQSVRIGGSIGIAIFPDHGDDPQALLNRADLAMYQAKAAGRGTYRFAATD